MWMSRIDWQRRCDEGFTWNPSNSECECDKSCDIGQYLDYKNCECRKQLIKNVVEECGENINRTEIIYNGTLSVYEKVCNSGTIYIVQYISSVWYYSSH